MLISGSWMNGQKLIISSSRYLKFQKLWIKKYAVIRSIHTHLLLNVTYSTHTPFHQSVPVYFFESNFRQSALDSNQCEVSSSSSTQSNQTERNANCRFAARHLVTGCTAAGVVSGLSLLMRERVNEQRAPISGSIISRSWGVVDANFRRRAGICVARAGDKVWWCGISLSLTLMWRCAGANHGLARQYLDTPSAALLIRRHLVKLSPSPGAPPPASW